MGGGDGELIKSSQVSWVRPWVLAYQNQTSANKRRGSSKFWLICENVMLECLHWWQGIIIIETASVH